MANTPQGRRGTAPDNYSLIFTVHTAHVRDSVAAFHFQRKEQQTQAFRQQLTNSAGIIVKAVSPEKLKSVTSHVSSKSVALPATQPPAQPAFIYYFNYSLANRMRNYGESADSLGAD